MASATEQLTKAILGRHAVVFLRTWEEERAAAMLRDFAARVGSQSGVHVPIWSWSCVTGLAHEEGGVVPGSTDPLVAIQEFVAHAAATPAVRQFALFRDLSVAFDRADVVRALREAYTTLTRTESFLFIVAPKLELPGALAKEVFLADLEMPTEREIIARIREIGSAYPDVLLEPSLLSDVAVGLRGLTLNESTHILERIYRAGKSDRDAVLAEVFTEKEAIVKKSGFLEYVPQAIKIEDIGGLDNMKAWLEQRRKLFTLQAIADGMPTPKGILIMGMSGCGKSMCAKAASALWQVPLFRLDMNLVFSGLYGSPEAAFHRALEAIEALAPAILWIDEIENSLGHDEQAGGSQVSSSVFAAFLTWMQEKPPLVFVAATANRIQALPAEVIRKGRFDQVFFVDLPGIDERKEILDIHLKRHGADPAKFDTHVIAGATRGWNGAEIEQAVISARVEAYQEKRKFDREDFSKALASIVPLSRTMEEQMKKIRSWAYARATPASSGSRIPT